MSIRMGDVVRSGTDPDLWRVTLPTIPGWYGLVGLERISDGHTQVHSGAYLRVVTPRVDVTEQEMPC